MPAVFRGALLPAPLLAACCLVAQVHAQTAPTAVIEIQAPTGFRTLLTDSARTLSIPSQPRPGYLKPVTDPTFGTRVTRIAGDGGVSIGGGISGSWSTDVRQHYSKDQPWNADGTLLALQNGGGGLVLLDGESYQPKLAKCSSYSMSDDRWHPSKSHANERINVRGSELMWYDVVRCVKTRSWTLPFSVQYLGQGEGNPSNDGRFVALSDGMRMFVVDMDPKAPFAAYPASRIGPAVAIDECGLSGGCKVDWVSISASGKYAIVSYDGDFVRVFDVDPNTLALTPRAMPSGATRCHGTAETGFVYDLGHADLATNPFDANEDVIVGQEHCGNRGRTVNGQVMSGVIMVRLRDGKVTSLTSAPSEAYPHHISARNLDRPGWVYVGYHDDSGRKFTDEILAVKMDGSKTVQRMAHKHSVYSGCYRCESHSVPSRDGRRVLWASNWASNCTTCGTTSDIKPYVVDTRAIVSAGGTTLAPYPIVSDASRSFDSDGAVIAYKFDFGDGSVVGPQLSPLAYHLYRAGKWNLRVTVTDNTGAMNTATRIIDVSGSQGSNQPPAAMLSVSPSTGVGPLTVILDASDSTDPDGSIVRYQFDFGDGASQSGASPSATHVYRTGTWTARVTAFDAAGASSQATAVVTVTDTPPPPPTPPRDSVGVNVVKNPSFEFDVSGWKGYHGGTIARAPGGVDGNGCVQIRGPAVPVEDFGINDGPNWVTSVPAAGTRYRVTAWVRALGVLGTVRIQMREYANGVQQAPAAYSRPVTLGLLWQELALDFTTLTTGSTIDVQIIDNPLQTGEAFYADNISIRMLSATEPELAFATRAVRGGETGAIGAPVVMAPRVSPNPMRGRGAIDFATAMPGALHVALYDVTGRVIRVLADERMAPAGSRRLDIDGRDQAGAVLPAGVYYYRVVNSGGRFDGRVVLVK